MSYLSREEILKAEDLETRDVDVPEWGGAVRVRALSGTDRDAFEASKLERQADGTFGFSLLNLRAKLAARSIVDENGELMFNELDVGRLGQKSAAALDRVFQVASELSGLDKAAGDELEGNSDAAPSGDSGSSSPAN